MTTLNRVLSSWNYFLAILFLVFTTSSFAAGIAFDYIPATDCQPTDHNAVKKLELKDASWQFRGSETGTVTIECPIEALGSFVPPSVGSVLVVFKDSDGADHDTSASFQLFSRAFETVDSYGSYITDTAATSDATFGLILGGVPVFTEFWFVRVQLKRFTRHEQIVVYGMVATD